MSYRETSSPRAGLGRSLQQAVAAAPWEGHGLVPVKRPRAIALALLALNFALFVPGYVLSHRHADLLPFFPQEHPHGAFGFDARSFVEYLKALFLRRSNLDVFRVCLEYVALLSALALTARTRLRGLTRWLAVGLYVFALLFLTYHHALQYFFLRRPALSQDFQLVINLGHFLSEMGPTYWLGFGLGGAGLLVTMGAVAHWAFLGLQRWAEPVLVPRLVGGSLLALGLGLASVLWFGPDRDDPVVQALSKRAWDNLQASRDAAARNAQLATGAPDKRYDAFDTLTLRRRPTFYFLMIEAYGEILATWDMAPAYQALLRRVEGRLAARGFHATSFYSAAPVHGGWSWFSIATTQTGILIETPQVFSAFEDHRAGVPTLERFFKRQHYATWSLQPGTAERPGLLIHDLYEHDLLVNADLIGYHGRRWGFGGIPDQYAFAFMKDRYLKAAPDPLYLFYMAVSTHYPWGDHVPPYVKDPLALERGVVEPSNVDDTWPAIAEKEQIGSEYRKSYFQSVEYEWRVLTEFLEADPSQDIVVVVMGDHQPRLESNPPGEVTMNTPVHILSKDPAFVASFAQVGAQRGLSADPTLHPPLQHEGLFSLLVSRLAALYGDEQSQGRATWSPDGAELSGLNR
jgi:hypothetical protein